MRNGEYGIVIRQNCGFDISGFTSLAITFTKPSGATISKTDANVTVGSTAIETDRGTFAANQYWEYTFQNGDVNEAGEWTVETTYTDATKKLISDKGKFTVFAA